MLLEFLTWSLLERACIQAMFSIPLEEDGIFATYIDISQLVCIIGGICLLMCIYCAYKERYLIGLFFAMLTSLFGWLPFISYVGRLKFYFGVRERGNWGWKLTRK